MTRKALARRTAEPYLTSQQRGEAAAAAPTRRAARILAGGRRTQAEAAPLRGYDRVGLASEAALHSASARKQRVVNRTQLFHFFSRKFHQRRPHLQPPIIP